MSYEDIKNARKTAQQVLAEEKAENKYGIDIDALMDTPMMQGYRPGPTDDPIVQRLKMAQYVMGQSGHTTLKPVLPLLLSIRGKPYHLHDH